ncbi:hypothetical protein Tco_0472938 [Tanacetum coccineum]
MRVMTLSYMKFYCVFLSFVTLKKTLTTKQGLSSSAIEQLIAQRVADVMTTYEANQNSGSGINNETSGSAGGVEHTARDFSYKEFLTCKPRNFNGTKGAVGLTRWFEKMKSVFHICNCVENYQVKTGIALPHYGSPEYKKIKRYIRGLTDDIQRNVTSSKPTKIQESICIAHDLMDQVMGTKAAKGVDTKRKSDDNQRNNSGQQNKRQEVVKAFTIGSAEKKGYIRTALSATDNSELPLNVSLNFENEYVALIVNQLEYGGNVEFKRISLTRFRSCTSRSRYRSISKQTTRLPMPRCPFETATMDMRSKN